VFIARPITVVHDIKDRKFWKQITTLFHFSIMFLPLFTTSKIENFESKSQPYVPFHSDLAVVHDIKDRKFWKQITTDFHPVDVVIWLFTTSKIENFESKSQLMEHDLFTSTGCSRHQRSKILKANHNAQQRLLEMFNVVHDIKDRKFWKQITTINLLEIIDNCCSRHQRSKILKANHNTSCYKAMRLHVVHDIKDRKFWKQIGIIN